MINVIKADFTSWDTCTTEKCYMYDKGQILQITGLQLPEYFEVHFSNTENGTAKKAIGHNNFVNIYNEYFESGKPIYCYILLNEGNDDIKTVYKVTIPIIKRSRPTDEQPTPEQESLIEQALAALLDATQRANYYANLFENSSAEATTLEPGSEATASYSEGVFTFGIPQGAQGVQGEPGPQGDRGYLLLHVETAPIYGNYTPDSGADHASYKISQSNVLHESGTIAKVGDIIEYMGYYYPVVGMGFVMVFMSDPYPVQIIPAGGTAGQFLVKKTNADYDMEWKTVPEAAGNSF